MTLTVDSVEYDVFIEKVIIDGQFLYKFAERTISGDFNAEAIGFVENQSITILGNNDNDFVSLYEALSTINADGNYNKTVEVFSPLGKYEFEMYPDKLRVELKRYVDGAGNDYFGSITIQFTATSCVR